MIARMPVRSAASSSERSKPSRLSISSWLRMRSDRRVAAVGQALARPPASASAGGRLRLRVFGFVGHALAMRRRARAGR